MIKYIPLLLLLASCTTDIPEEYIVDYNVDEEPAPLPIDLKPIWPSIQWIDTPSNSEKGYDTVHIVYDFDRDGYEDVLFAPNSGDDEVRNTPLELYINLGDNLSFKLDSSIISNNIGPVTARKASTGDFNGDGKLDVVFADHSIHGDNEQFPGGTPSTLLSTPSGYLFNFLEELTPSFYHGSAAGDFDLDGKDEIFLGSYFNPNLDVVEYFLEYEDGEFKIISDIFEAQSATLASEFYDVNNDGFLDFIHASIHEAWVYYGNGTDFLSEPVKIAERSAYFDIYDIDFYDMDGDGFVEIFLLRNGGDQYIQVLSLDDSGNYVDKSQQFVEQKYNYGHSVVWLSIGDITGDGIVNLYETENHGNDVALWKFIDGYFKFIGN